MAKMIADRMHAINGNVPTGATPATYIAMALVSRCAHHDAHDAGVKRKLKK
jgi:hypothetical protein